nr:MAG TPA: hypothetical protein [Caudoviricetes sp.]
MNISNIFYIPYIIGVCSSGNRTVCSTIDIPIYYIIEFLLVVAYTSYRCVG